MLRKAFLILAAATVFAAIVVDVARRWMAAGRLEKIHAGMGEWEYRLTHQKTPDPDELSPFRRKLLPIIAHPTFVTMDNLALAESTGRDLRILGGMDSVTLYGAKGLTPAIVADLSRIHTITFLGIDGSDITDDELNLLWRGLSELQSAEMEKIAIGDEGLRDVAHARKLKTLDISHTRIADRAVNYMRGLPHLDSLDLYDTQVTEQSAEALASLPALTEVLFPNSEAGRRLREKLKSLNPAIGEPPTSAP